MEYEIDKEKAQLLFVPTDYDFKDKKEFKPFVALVPKSEWSLQTCVENLACEWSYDKMRQQLPKGSQLVKVDRFCHLLNNPEYDISRYNVRCVSIWMTSEEYIFNY